MADYKCEYLCVSTCVVHAHCPANVTSLVRTDTHKHAHARTHKHTHKQISTCTQIHTQVRVPFLEMMASLAVGEYGTSLVLRQFAEMARSPSLEVLTWRKLFTAVVEYCVRYNTVLAEVSDGESSVCFSSCHCGSTDHCTSHQLCRPRSTAVADRTSLF